MFPRWILSAVSLLSVMVIFSAVTPSVKAITFSPLRVIKVFPGSASAALPDSDRKGLNFECGRNFAMQVYREYYEVPVKEFTGSIVKTKAYSVKLFNKSKVEMNLVKIAGRPFSFYIKKLGEDNYEIIEENPQLDCDGEQDSLRIKNVNDI